MLGWLTRTEQRVLTRWLEGDVRSATGATRQAEQQRRDRLLQALQDRAEPNWTHACEGEADGLACY